MGTVHSLPSHSVSRQQRGSLVEERGVTEEVGQGTRAAQDTGGHKAPIFCQERVP